jgi:hypothetical protein
LSKLCHFSQLAEQIVIRHFGTHGQITSTPTTSPEPQTIGLDFRATIFGERKPTTGGRGAPDSRTSPGGHLAHPRFPSVSAHSFASKTEGAATS